MAELKTKPTTASVARFITAVTPETRRVDAPAVVKLMRRATGERPRLWGSSIVGFGTYRATYASGREVEWMLTGFSPRKSSLVLYVMSGFPRHAGLVAKLGKIKTGKGCLYVNRLADVDTAVLEELIHASVAHMRRKHAGK